MLAWCIKGAEERNDGGIRLHLSYSELPYIWLFNTTPALRALPHGQMAQLKP